MREGVDPNKVKKQARAKQLTLREAADLYINGTKVRAARTTQTYRYALDYYLSDWLDRPLAEITRKDCYDRHQRIGRDHGHYVANNAMAVLRGIYNRALKQFEDLPPVNPTIAVEVEKALRAPPPMDRKLDPLAELSMGLEKIYDLDEEGLARLAASRMFEEKERTLDDARVLVEADVMAVRRLIQDMRAIPQTEDEPSEYYGERLAIRILIGLLRSSDQTILFVKTESFVAKEPFSGAAKFICDVIECSVKGWCMFAPDSYNVAKYKENNNKIKELRIKIESEMGKFFRRELKARRATDAFLGLPDSKPQKKREKKPPSLIKPVINPL